MLRKLKEIKSKKKKSHFKKESTFENHDRKWAFETCLEKEW